MTDYPYSAPCSHSLVYMHEIPGSANHTGHLKVGDTSLKSPKKASELKVNCAELKAAAKKRIDRPEATFPQKSLGVNSNFEVPLRRRNVIRAISARKSSQKKVKEACMNYKDTISRRGILGCDVHCLCMSEGAPFFYGCQVNG